MIVCDCMSRGHAKCVCGAFKDGVLVDGATLRIPLLLKDDAPKLRKEFHLMNDSEKKTMRDSVRGMPAWQAAKLPLYDDVRGYVTSGMPSEMYFAIRDGADGNRSIEPTEENIRRLGDQRAARQSYVHDLGNRWRGDPANPGNDNRTPPVPQYSRDGRPMSSLSDGERAREEMIIRQSSAWMSN